MGFTQNPKRPLRDCADCGKRTEAAGLRCRVCLIAEYKRLRRIELIEAIRLWNDIYGSPPGAADWNVTLAKRDPSRRERWLSGSWPGSNSVQRVFGTWAAGIEAAGFVRPEAGRYGRPGDDPEKRRIGTERLRAGQSQRLVAAELGVSTSTVRTWARAAGLAPPAATNRQRRLPWRRHPVDAELRWAVWERDDFRCLECGTRRNLTVDHVQAVAFGGTNTLENLQTLCQPCNSRKGTALAA